MFKQNRLIYMAPKRTREQALQLVQERRAKQGMTTNKTVNDPNFQPTQNRGALPAKIGENVSRVTTTQGNLVFEDNKARGMTGEFTGTETAPGQFTGGGITQRRQQEDSIFNEPKQPQTIQDVVKTYREQAEEQELGSYLEFAKDYEKIMGKPAPFQTRQEFIDWQKSQGAADLEYLKQQQAIQREVEGSQTQTALEQMTGAMGATTASMAQGREGAMSGTAPQFASEFNKQMGRQKQQMEAQRRSAELSRQKALEDLERAQERGDVDMAEAIQGNIASIEQTIRQIETQALQAATLANEQALKAYEVMGSEQRANLNTFTSMVDQGIVLDTNAIMGFAGQLNVPFEMAYSYYNGAQQIRDDKSMDAAGKQIALAQLNQDFQDGWLGERSQEAKSAQFFQNALQSGNYSKSQLQELAIAMGIPNEMNPVFMNELRMNNAEAKIKEYEAKYLGKEPPQGSKEWYDYQINKLEYEQARNDLYETAGGFSVSVSNEFLDSTVTQRFDTDIGYNIPGQRDGKHDGLDFVLPGGLGADVRTPISGVARVVEDPNPGKNKGWGNQVIITDSEGRDHMFGHLNSINITNGDFISAGTVIGGQGNTGYTSGKTGIHVDYRIKQDGAYINPEEFLKNPPVSIETPEIEEWGYTVLDGRANISNIPDDLRTDVVKFVNKKLKEGYKSDYPVLTESQLKLVNQISDDFNSDKSVTDILDVQAGFETVRTVYGDSDNLANATGFDDIAAINAFQRMVDPGATVREGDVTLLETAIPFLERVSPSFQWSKFSKGDKLPVSVRESLIRVAEDLYNNKANVFNETVGGKYKKRAEASNVPSDLVITTFPLYEDGEKVGGEDLSEAESIIDQYTDPFASLAEQYGLTY